MYLQTSEIIQYTLFAFFGTMAIAFSIYISELRMYFMVQ